MVAQTALALVLLVGSGLLARSFTRVMGAAHGFVPDHVLTFRIALSQAAYPKPPEIARFTEAVRDDLYGPMWEGGLSARYRSILDEIGDGTPVSIEWFMIPTGSSIERRSVGELEVRSASGAVVVAVIHGRAVDPRPGPDSEIHPGDRVALLGTSEEREKAREVIESAFPVSSTEPAR